MINLYCQYHFFCTAISRTYIPIYRYRHTVLPVQTKTRKLLILLAFLRFSLCFALFYIRKDTLADNEGVPPSNSPRRALPCTRSARADSTTSGIQSVGMAGHTIGARAVKGAGGTACGGFALDSPFAPLWFYDLADGIQSRGRRVSKGGGARPLWRGAAERQRGGAPYGVEGQAPARFHFRRKWYTLLHHFDNGYFLRYNYSAKKERPHARRGRRHWKNEWIGGAEMAHVAKFTRGASGHMLGHYSREKEHLPDNIKPELTHLNYNLAGDYQPMKQIDFIRQRLSEVKVQKRSDVNVLCDWVVTAPKDLPAEDLGQFFESTHAFLAGKYGKENVVSAYVHMDEATPHLHFAFIPVVPDKKKGGYKVSAKECITRSQLKSFHNELQRRLENELGHPVSILNEATKEGNKSIEELKRQTATERLREANEKAAQIVSKARERVKVVEQDIQALEGKKAALEGEIEALEVKLQGRQLQIREVMEIKPEYEKGLFGSVKGIKGVTVSDIENLKATAIKGLEARDRLEKLTFEYERVKKLVPTMDERMKDAQDKIRLEQLEKAFQRLPEHIQKQLLPAKNKSHDRGRER